MEMNHTTNSHNFYRKFGEKKNLLNYRLKNRVFIDKCLKNYVFRLHAKCCATLRNVTLAVKSPLRLLHSNSLRFVFFISRPPIRWLVFDFAVCVHSAQI